MHSKFYSKFYRSIFVFASILAFCTGFFSCDFNKGKEDDESIITTKNASSTLSSSPRNAEVVEVPYGITVIESGVFEGNTVLKKVIIPKTVVRIGSGQFRGCTSLEEVVFKDAENDGSREGQKQSKLESINDELFKGCVSLREIKIPSSVKKIGASAFEDCASLRKVTYSIYNSLDIMGNKAFKNCTSLTDITFPSSVNYIGEEAFYGCKKLQGNPESPLTLSAELEEIRKRAFYDCEELRAVGFPSNSVLKKIGEEAFCYCTSLEAITIPDSCTEIGKCAFYYAYTLDNQYVTGIVFENGFNWKRRTSLDDTTGIAINVNDAHESGSYLSDRSYGDWGRWQPRKCWQRSDWLVD